MNTLKSWKFWIGAIISVIFLYVALRGLSLVELYSQLQNIGWWWLVPGIAVYFLAVWGRAWRWHYLLRPLKPVPTKELFPMVCIGYAGNNIFPARAGELLRAFVLKRHEDIPVSSSLATIFVERAFDGVVMLGFVFINLNEIAGLTSGSGFLGSIRALALLGTAAFITALVLFLLAAMYPKRANLAATILCEHLVPARFRDKVLGFMDRFIIGLESLRSPRDVLMVFVTSVVIWLLETVKYWFVMHAFPFEVSFFALMLMNGIVNLATTIPSAPGYIGTFDAPGIAVLQAYGVEKVLAAAYTLILHGALWLPITLLGLYYGLREGISWGQDMDELRAET